MGFDGEQLRVTLSLHIPYLNLLLALYTPTTVYSTSILEVYREGGRERERKREGGGGERESSYSQQRPVVTVLQGVDTMPLP